MRRRIDRKEAIALIGERVNGNVAPDERAKFREMAESDLLGLHEGNLARLSGSTKRIHAVANRMGKPGTYIPGS